mgnify:CR=1 FL=1
MRSLQKSPMTLYPNRLFDWCAIDEQAFFLSVDELGAFIPWRHLHLS